MKIELKKLILTTRQMPVEVDFSKSITFLHGPIGKGKSSVARLVNYCLGGRVERTPALQQEFVSATLFVTLGSNECIIERGAEDTQSVRISWETLDGEVNSVNAPLVAQAAPLIDAEVFNFSDLIFHLCDVTPIKVRKAFRDPESQMVRLSFRDIWRYCYLDQTHLDSSFFRLEDPNRGRKSQDAMRFFTGLHSERLSQLDTELLKTLDEQKGKREAVKRIREFMERFDIESEDTLFSQIADARQQLELAKAEKSALEASRTAQTHPSDALRDRLRLLSYDIDSLQTAIIESTETITEQGALKSELITAKTKAMRSQDAGQVLEGVKFERCPQCGTHTSTLPRSEDSCSLCGAPEGESFDEKSTLGLEVQRRDINERIDQLADSISRRQQELRRTKRNLDSLQRKKSALDNELQEELSRYDSAFVESIRKSERDVATFTERIRLLERLQQMPQAINDLEEEAGTLQGKIDRLRTSIRDEKFRLRDADANIAAIAAEFHRIMLAVSFPGLETTDQVTLDPRNWRPIVEHDDQAWSFWDTGSGGKKTLFNVCYALAIHAVGLEKGMPVPTLLVIDSPTKNISDDENPELVRSLYDEIYRMARS
jgi:uncharacterized protein YydD (DUF2326 family)